MTLLTGLVELAAAQLQFAVAVDAVENRRRRQDAASGSFAETSVPAANQACQGKSSAHSTTISTPTTAQSREHGYRGTREERSQQQWQGRFEQFVALEHAISVLAAYGDVVDGAEAHRDIPQVPQVEKLELSELTAVSPLDG